MTSSKIRMRYVSAAAAMVFLVGGASYAQQAEQPAQTAQAAISPVSDAEVTQFVAANKKITEVANKASAELQAASDETVAAAIQTKAEQDIVIVIEKEGLTAARYQEIIVLAENDETTLAKLRAEFGG